MPDRDRSFGELINLLVGERESAAKYGAALLAAETQHEHDRFEKLMLETGVRIHAVIAEIDRRTEGVVRA